MMTKTRYKVIFFCKKFRKILIVALFFSAFLFAFCNYADTSIYRGDIKLSGGQVSNLALKNPVLMVDGRYYIPLTGEYLATIGLSSNDYAVIADTPRYASASSIYLSHTSLEDSLPESEFGENIDIRKIKPLVTKIYIDGQLLRTNYPPYCIEGIAYICIDDTNDFQYDSTGILRRGIKTKAPELPEYLNSLDMHGTENFVKNQGSTQDCWAYAAASLIEIKIATEQGVFYDVSEADIIKDCPIPSTSLTGGSWRGSSSYFANGLGEIYISEYREISGVENIKAAIQKNGAVLTSIYYGPARSKFYNREKYAYYHHDEAHSATHELVLIGWDDSFPKENFETQPAEDGAFIAMNSFGENFGDRGLFYISYCDDIATKRTYTVDSYTRLPESHSVLAVGASGVTHYETLPGKGDIYGIVRMRLSDFDYDENRTPRIRGIGVFSSGGAIVSAYYSELFPSDYTKMTFLGDTYFDEAGFQLIECPYNTALPEEFHIVLKYTSLKKFILPIEAPYPGIDYEIFEPASTSFIAHEDIFGAKKLIAEPLANIKQKASVTLRLIIE